MSSSVIASMLVGSAAAALTAKSGEFDGAERVWDVIVPDSVVNGTFSSLSKVPLVVHLHGLTGFKEGLGYTGWGNMPEEKGFIVVRPQGLGIPGPANVSDIDNVISSSWNMIDGVCCGVAGANSVDDVKFLRAVVTSTLQEQPKADSTRIYFIGHSNGCSMAQRFAAEASDLVTAVACESFYQSNPISENYIPVPIMETHGLQDDVVEYLFKEDIYAVKGAEDNIEKWAENNGCSTDSKDAVTFNDDDAGFYSVTYRKGCRSNAVARLVTIPEGGQSGHAPYPLFATEEPIDTVQMAWNFLEEYGTRNEVFSQAAAITPSIFTGVMAMAGIAVAFF